MSRKRAIGIFMEFPWRTLLMVCLALALSLNVTGAYGAAQKSLVDLNTASQKDLEGLKGVGPATAKKIIAARPYQSVDELAKAGLKPKQIEALKPMVTVGAVPKPAPPVAAPAAKAPAATPATPAPAAKPTPAKEAAPIAAKLAPGEKININTATKEELDKLPDIGPVKAQAIIEGRPYNKIEDVMKVKGIKKGIFEKIKDNITVN
jgi:competence protein ComEA